MTKDEQIAAARRVQDEFVQELQKIYDNRTAVPYTFEGLLYHYMVNYQAATGIQVFPR